MRSPDCGFATNAKNPANVAKATLQALQSMRLREDVMKGRGKNQN